jgi:hypothetical protein
MLFPIPKEGKTKVERSSFCLPINDNVERKAKGTLYDMQTSASNWKTKRK